MHLPLHHRSWLLHMQRPIVQRIGPALSVRQSALVRHLRFGGDGELLGRGDGLGEGLGSGLGEADAGTWHVPDRASADALPAGWQRSGSAHAEVFARQQRLQLALMHSTLLLLLLLLHASWPGAHCVLTGGGLVTHVAPVAGQYCSGEASAQLSCDGSAQHLLAAMHCVPHCFKPAAVHLAHVLPGAGQYTRFW